MTAASPALRTVPALQLLLSANSLAAIVIGVRDFVGGLTESILDPSEGAVSHDLLFDIGLSFP